MAAPSEKSSAVAKTCPYPQYLLPPLEAATAPSLGKASSGRGSVPEGSRSSRGSVSGGSSTGHRFIAEGNSNGRGSVLEPKFLLQMKQKP